ncbi:MAG: thioredoxin domain-containing protein [Candidatus Marinimicrobia bacterium]|nr:thioredoxin domain-containing protein [Candidatus Neomarinimicrobiota bacterium]MBL7030904.1 thioredoxin domain-containing protein [Candidatus Neomarinimicrobiota bacterium]
MRNTSISINLKHLISITILFGLIPHLWGQPNHNESNQKEKYVNRLAESSSPYLLQHKNNPVDWYPWGDEAFQKAAELDRPIFLSIGYSTCHWCHVMAHESFEDEQVAQLLNENFISIKVDREELPEIDHVYMSVCQAMTGRGGWPLTIIMTPDKEPFFAGTYFPKNGRFGRPGMTDLLPSIADAWKNKRAELVQSAERINEYLLNSNTKKLGNPLAEAILKETYSQFVNRYDKSHGGFGTQPKFPSPHNLVYLLRYHHMTEDKTALKMVEKTLQEMRLGGIFDHVGYGFHRYSTDKEWLVPHFEKMLYDQAMLVMAYIEAFQITGNSVYQKTAEEILTYVKRDMTDTDGGFYSAEDADSEGEEGLFYVWTTQELKSILGEEDTKFIQSTFNLTSDGNFKDEVSRQSTGKNIFHLKSPISNLKDLEKISKIREKLFTVREKRIHPLKDDKILTDWNGLMIASMAKAGVAFQDKVLIESAEKSAKFIFNNLMDKKGRLQKRYRNGKSGLDAHLDDYAFFIWGLLELYEATFKIEYLKNAIQLSETMVSEFWNESSGGFYLGSNQAEKLIVRAMTGYDGAIPSGNSIAAMNLLKLTRITGEVKWAEMADKTFKVFSNEIKRTPTGYTSMVTAFLFELDHPKEIVVVGSGSDSDTQAALDRIRSEYIPGKVLLFKDLDHQNSELSTLARWTDSQETIDDKTTFYVCQDFACKIPTTDIEQALRFIHE